MNFKRGDIILAANPGDYGKPRPCLILQSNLFDDLASVTFCILTSTLRNDRPLIRVDIAPSAENGLREDSQIAVDKIFTLPKSKIAKIVGRASEEVMSQVTRALAVFLEVR